MTNIILASQSPRRKELLSHLGFDFDIIVSNIAEHSDLKDVNDFVIDIATQKAMAVKNSDNQKKVYIGADTIVVYGNEILGKPTDTQQARETLLKLSGDEHEVYTGVCLIDNRGEKLNLCSFSQKSTVIFNTIDTYLLDLYLSSGESMDKAGAYGIQGQALSFIASINGSYSNVVGLPIDLVYDELKKMGAI